MAHAPLFSPLTLRGLTLRNRIGVSPMCMYSAKNGFANEFHFAHTGRFALGGFGLVMIESTGVAPEGRITYGDLGLWSDDHVEPLAKMARFIQAQGAVAGIQLNHAGRKSATWIAWRESFNERKSERDDVGFTTWTPLAPSALRHADNWSMPAELDLAGIAAVVSNFRAAAARAHRAGLDVLELHAAHGFLIHQFLSPLANLRSDAYGGSFENRTRLACEIVEAVRMEWPEHKPLFVRLSVSDYDDRSWSVDDSVALAKLLKARGVDLIDSSSGGFSFTPPERQPLYQVPFAKAVRLGADIATGAVGLIEEPRDANAIIEQGAADIVLLGRGALQNPNWPLNAQLALAQTGYELWPKQFGFWIKGRDVALGRTQSE